MQGLYVIHLYILYYIDRLVATSSRPTVLLSYTLTKFTVERKSSEFEILQVHPLGPNKKQISTRVNRKFLGKATQKPQKSEQPTDFLS